MEAAPSTESVPHGVIRRTEWALRSPTAHLRLWGVAAAALWLDLASKNWAFSKLDPRGQQLVPGILDARRSLNSGALFGSFSGWVPAFIIASLLALGFVIYYFAASGRKQRFMHLGLAFILAGALGNLYDRAFIQADIVKLLPTAAQGPSRDIGIMLSDLDADPVMVGNYPDGASARQYARSAVEAIDHHGVVRDFLKFTPIAGFDYWPWIFNVADALLVVGVPILLVTVWRESRALKKARQAAATARCCRTDTSHARTIRGT